jgi:O-antigen/teichoic acid export membrane protein
LAKEGIWILVGQISSVLGALVLVRVLTEYLDPVQYGQVALGLTVTGLVDQVAMGGLSNGISRFYSVAAEKNDFGRYLGASWRLMAYATLVVVAIGISLLVVLSVVDEWHLVSLAAAALVFSLLSTYNATLGGIQNAARQRAVVAFHGALDAWLKILLAVAMVLWLGASSAAVVFAYALSALLVTSSQVLFLRRLIPHQSARVADSTPWARQIWAYAWPFSCWGVFTWAQQSSDRWALAAFASTQEVGLYAVLFQLGYTPIAIATGMAVSFIGPILYQRSGDASSHSRNANVHRLAWRVTLVCLTLTLIAFLVTLSLHEWIFRFLVAAEFRVVSNLLPWVVLAGGLFAAAQMLALKLLSDMRSATMLWAKIVTAVLGIGFNIYGASVAGANGVAFAALGFSVLYFVWMLHLSRPRLATTLAHTGPL